MTPSELQKLILDREDAERWIALCHCVRLLLTVRLFFPGACYFDSLHWFVVLWDSVTGVVMWNAAGKLEKVRVQRWTYSLLVLVALNCWKLYWLDC